MTKISKEAEAWLRDESCHTAEGWSFCQEISNELNQLRSLRKSEVPLGHKLEKTFQQAVVEAKRGFTPPTGSAVPGVIVFRWKD